MINADQRRLLGEFVRAHRERLTPPDPPGRRRTPGLRREELAHRAGISVTWCAWIEQGRQVQASPEALHRLAAALALSPAERSYLFELAGRIDPSAGQAADHAPPASLTAATDALTCPAYGLDRLWNACAWNDAAARLFRGWLDGDGERNLLRFVFLSDAADTLIPDRRDRARRLLAEFRADYGHHFKDERVRALVADLQRDSPLFAEAWHAQDVQHREGGLRTFVAEDGDLLSFTQHSFNPADQPDFKLVVLFPAGGKSVRATG